ncbi:uncharacterized protein [Dermacentor albipictus]|uniref:uncharacterized protein n=1 Tax=Dermacentor albipictus TaxID=60249 RepID=UPI0031FCD852
MVPHHLPPWSLGFARSLKVFNGVFSELGERSRSAFQSKVLATLITVWSPNQACASDGLHCHNLGDSVIEVSVDGDMYEISENIPPFLLTSALAPSSVTSRHVGLPAPLKRVALQVASCGPGSSASGMLLQNPLCFSVQKKHMVVQGDHSDKQRTTCILQSLLSWNAAGNFSWFGAKGKKFAKLHLCKLMYVSSCVIASS